MPWEMFSTVGFLKHVRHIISNMGDVQSLTFSLFGKLGKYYNICGDVLCPQIYDDIPTVLNIPQDTQDIPVGTENPTVLSISTILDIYYIR